MNDLPQALAEAGLKIQWAKRHVVKLIPEFKAIINSEPTKLVIEYDRKTGKKRPNVVSTADFPPSIPLTIGDTVHNIRTAFDYVFVALAGDEKMAMPVGKERSDIETKSGYYRTIKEKWPRIADFLLDTIQPYKGGKFRLWEVSELDRIDKHRLIIPTRNRAYRLGVELEDEHGQRIPDVWFGVHASVPSPFGNEVKIKKEGYSVLDVSFGPGTPLEGEAALGTLFECCENAVAALGELRERFAAEGLGG